MDEFQILILLIIITVVILNIILFFKVWGMTNNIKLLTSIYRHDKGIKEEEIKDELGSITGYWLVDKDGNEIKVR